MPEFALRIKVDPTDAPAKIADVKKPLDELEAAGPRVGKAIAKGMQDSASSAEYAQRAFKGVADAIRADALNNTAKAFAGLSEQMKREADVLERIRGPQREYMADLGALDKLLEKNMISTQEYADQVTRLNQSIEKRPRTGGGGGGGGAAAEEGGLRIEGNLFGALASQAGEYGSAIGGLVSSGALEAGALAAVAAEAVRLDEEYDQLRNATLRLTGSSTTVTLAMQQQLDIAGDLHAGLEQTIELSTQVREHTDTLNLSVGEQNRLTKELGEIAVESGHSVSDAGQIIQRLGSDFEEGIPAGRDLRSLFRDFPPLLDAMKDHFHTTGKGLIDMANNGQINMQDFVQSVDDGSAKIQQDFGGRVETVGEMWQHTKDKVTTSWTDWVAHATGMSNAASDLQHQMGLLAEAQLQLYQQQEKLDKATIEAADDAERYAYAHTELADAISNTTKAMSDATKLLAERDDKVVSATQKERDYAAAVGLVRDKLAQFSAAGAKNPMALLTQGDIDIIRGYQDAQEAANDAVSRYGGVLSEIHKREDERRRGLEDLQGALKAHLITQQEYSEELKKYQQPLSEEEQLLKSIVSPLQDIIRRERELGDLRADGRISAEQYTVAIDKETEAYKKLALEISAAKIQENAAKYQNMGPAITPVNTNVAMAATDLLLKQTQLRDQAEKTAKAYDLWEQHATDAISGIDRGLHSIVRDTENIGREIELAFKNAFNNANAALVDFIMTGTSDWSKLVSTIEKDAARLGIQAIEGGIMHAVTDQGGPSAATMQTGAAAASTTIGSGITAAGATAGSTIAAAMTSAGTAVAAQIAAAMATGGVTDAATTAAATSAVEDLPVLAAANGFDGTVTGGSAATDRQLFTARVSRHERIQITPAGQEAKQGGSAAAPPHVNVFFDKKHILQAFSGPEGKRIILDVLRQVGR